MRAAVICAVLIASVLEARAAAVLADGEDSASEVTPWVIRTEESGFTYQTGAGGAGYQLGGYQSFTSQANRYLWLHGGFRSRETQSDGLSTPYREWGSVKLAALAQAFPDLLYVLAAGSYVLGSTVLPLSDSLALSGSLNGYSPLPDPGFMSAAGGLIGLLLRFPVSSGEILSGFDYYRPGRINPYDTLSFFPSPWVDFSVRLRRLAEPGIYDAKLRLVIFTPETSGDKVDAHQEAPMVMASVAADGLGERRAWDFELGTNLKWKDRNRRVRLRVSPQETEVNDNLQRLWMGFRWKPKQGRTRLWTGLRGEALMQSDGWEAGYEARWEAGWQRGIGISNHASLTMHVLSASFQGTTYMGAGLAFGFSLRHLGTLPGP